MLGSWIFSPNFFNCFLGLDTIIKKSRKFALVTKYIDEKSGSDSFKFKVHSWRVNFVIKNVEDPGHDEGRPTNDQYHQNMMLRQGMRSSINIQDLILIRWAQQ